MGGGWGEEILRRVGRPRSIMAHSSWEWGPFIPLFEWNKALSAIDSNSRPPQEGLSWAKCAQFFQISFLDQSLIRNRRLLVHAFWKPNCNSVDHPPTGPSCPISLRCGRRPVQGRLAWQGNDSETSELFTILQAGFGNESSTDDEGIETATTRSLPHQIPQAWLLLRLFPPEKLKLTIADAPQAQAAADLQVQPAGRKASAYAFSAGKVRGRYI